MIAILGAGPAGLSSSYHLGHDNCVLFERNAYAGGHIYSHEQDGFVWDEGPHISFTGNSYVRELFERSVAGEYREIPVEVGNYYEGHWIPHPAQANLCAVPEPLRTACLNSFLNTRRRDTSVEEPGTYGQWLDRAFGPTFAAHFPRVYTEKYWGVPAEELATDWIGTRVYYPDEETVVRGYESPEYSASHYVRIARYPNRGGYRSFANALLENASVRYEADVVSVDLRSREIRLADGSRFGWERLVNTLPLPDFVRMTGDAPAEILRAADTLRSSSLLLVNVTADKPADHRNDHPFHWFYVYDEGMLSTRIHHVDRLSPNNAPAGKTGIQVEVYGSRSRPLSRNHRGIAARVVRELNEMGLIEGYDTVHTRYIPRANVIFDHRRREAQHAILSWLEQFGLRREKDDLEPMTDWEVVGPIQEGPIINAGRYAQWKYYLTDDCVLRGRQIAGLPVTGASDG